MPAKRDLDPGASPLHFFGAEVRRAREAADMTLADLGALVPCDASTVSKIEAGQLRPTERFVTACVETFPPLEWLGRFYEESQMWGRRRHPPLVRGLAESRARGDGAADLAAPPRPRPAVDRRLRLGVVPRRAADQPTEEVDQHVPPGWRGRASSTGPTRPTYGSSWMRSSCTA